MSTQRSTPRSTPRSTVVRPLSQSRRFYDIGSDVNWTIHGALHANIQRYRTYTPYDSDRPYNGTTINVVQFINWEYENGDDWTYTRQYDATSDDKRVPCRYAVECRTIDMAFYTRRDINNALECCGQPPLPLRKSDPKMPTALQIADMMHSYGHGDTQALYGNNAYKLLALGKRRMV